MKGYAANSGEVRVIFVLVYCFVSYAVGDRPRCSMNGTIELHCAGETVPIAVPEGVDHVVLEGIDLSTFKKGLFEHESWKTVLVLEIYSNAGRALYAESFTGLTNLKHLRLKGTDLALLGQRSFVGLPMLEKLDLSENAYLGFKEVLPILNESASTTLPALRWLNVAMLQPVRDTYVLNEGAFDILSARAIEYLDLSHANIAPLDVTAFNKLCSHLRHLKLNDATVTFVINIFYGLPKPCTSLKTLDVRNLYSNDLMGMLGYLKDFDLVKPLANVFNNVETLLMENVFHKKKVGEVNITHPVFDLTSNPLKFRKIDISRNNIRIFNVSINLHPETINSLKETDFSGNVLEYVTPRAFKSAVYTERLNLSHNYLNTMSQRHPFEFEMLVRYLTKLRVLDLSENSLASIPVRMFINNTDLEDLYLSSNRLTRIDFKLDHLVHLQTLDLSGNRIKVLNAESTAQFENMWQLRKEMTNFGGNWGSKPNVLLNHNPFECNCEEKYIRSIEWIEYSEFVQINGTAPFCTLDGQSIAISETASQRTRDYCHRILVMKYVLIVGASFGLIFAMIVIVSVVIYRRRARKGAIERFIKKIKRGNQLKNLIFLSFCNEDGDYVLENIYPKMKEEASRALECDRNLICCGELNFRPGMSVCLEAMRCIEDSAVVVFVVSNTFCQKSWCKMEVDTANAQRKPAILLMLENVSNESMTPYIRNMFNRYTRASWKDDENGGYPHPPWPLLIASVIELGTSFCTENQTAAERKGEVYELDDETTINETPQANSI